MVFPVPRPLTGTFKIRSSICWRIYETTVHFSNPYLFYSWMFIPTRAGPIRYRSWNSPGWGCPPGRLSTSLLFRSLGNPAIRLMVVSLGIVDPNSNETWMIEATPDFPKQLEILTGNDREKLKGVFPHPCPHRPLHRIGALRTGSDGCPSPYPFMPCQKWPSSWNPTVPGVSWSI